MKVIFLGATKFSEEMLKTLLANKVDVRAVFSIPESFNIKMKGATEGLQYKNTNYSDIHAIAVKNQIPSYFVSGGEESLSSYDSIIAEIDPDIILVLGWFYIVPKKIRNFARVGTFGIHASLLPSYAGGSPLVWALINGEDKTGITMFKIEEGIDDGDILAQDEINISFQDNIKTLYDKVIDAAKVMLVREIQNLSEYKAIFKVQDKSKIKPLPIRKPEDGLIDWNNSSLQIYNFVRAQTKPYPCAFSFYSDEKIKFVSVSDEGPVTDLAVDPGCIRKMNNNFYIKTGNGWLRPLLIEVNNLECTFDDFIKDKDLNLNKFESNKNEF